MTKTWQSLFVGRSMGIRAGILGLTLVASAGLLPRAALAQAQDAATYAKQNIEFAKQPAVPTPKPAKQNTLHPPPAPMSQPKQKPAPPVTSGPLPKGAAVDNEDNDKEHGEDPSNLIRAWENRRPQEQVKKAIGESLAMPKEPRDMTKPAKNPAQITPSDLETPGSTTTGWSQIGLGGEWIADGVHFTAGRIRQAAYAYDNSQSSTVLWLGATGGGLWKAVIIGIFGAVFVPVSDNLPGSPSVGAFLVQPGNSNNILIGSGDLYRYSGTGMYKTTNGGSSWYPVDPTDGTSWPDDFQKVLIDVNDSTNQTVLAQGDSGIWRSTDFGETWTQVYSGSTTDLVQDTNYPYIWYAGAPGIGVLRSTSYGQSFGPIGSGITAPIGRVSVALSASASYHVYAITAATNSNGLSTTLGGIWRSDDYGDGTWLAIETTDNISGAQQAFHTTSISVDPNNADIVFAGMAYMEVTYNGTATTPTWKHSSLGDFDDGHADHTQWIFESGTSNVISLCDGGVFVFDESTLSVSGSLNYSTGLNAQQVFGPAQDLACSRTVPDQCISGMQDNHVLTIDRNNSIPIVDIGLGGDGGAVSISPDTSAEQFAMEDGTRYYTTNSWSSDVSNYGSCLGYNSYATTMLDQTPSGGTFTPYIYTNANAYIYWKPVDPNCDWSAANSTALPSTWSTRAMDASNDPSAYVFYIVGWGTGTLYVMDSYSDGDLGSMTYENRTPPLPAGSESSDSQIEADRSNLRPYTVTYTTGASRPSRAFISNNRGKSWTNVTGDLVTKLPDASYWQLIANPSDQTQLFLGTSTGVYRSDNGGVNWYQYMNGLPVDINIDGLELNYDVASPPLLHIGSYGRGFWDRQVAGDAVLEKVTDDGPTFEGGKPMDFVVWLDRDAPVDATVSLSSSDQSVVPLPSNVTVSASYHNAGIVVDTATVTHSTVVTLSGTYNQVTKSIVVTIEPRPVSTTTLVSSKNPSIFGTAVTFSATVKSTTSGTITGSVAFKDGATVLGASTLSGGTATFAATSLGVGTNSITAVYSGDSNYSPSTSAILSQTVSKAGTSTALVSSANPSAFDQPVTFTATVTPATSGTPSGTVTFKNGSATLGMGTLSGGAASYTTSTLTLGAHSITATYNGSADYTTSASAALSQTVSKAGTSVTLVSSANPSTFNEVVKFTATVTPATAGTPTGTVTFKNGSATLGTATLSSGKALFSTSTLAVGVHSITAEYGGSTDYNTSTSSALSQTVNQAATTTTLVSSVNPSVLDHPVTFTATVKTSPSGTPTGTVTFKDGATTLGTATLSSSKAAFTTSSLAHGSHSITAVYNGSTDFKGSTSTVLTQKVN